MAASGEDVCNNTLPLVEYFVFIEWGLLMIEYAYYRPWQPPRRMACGLRSAWYGLKQLRRHTTKPGVESKSGPVQSELFSFALTRTTRAEDFDLGSEKRLRAIFLEEWPLNFLPAPLWASQPRGVHSYMKERTHRLHRAQNLYGLQLFIERNVRNGPGGSLVMPRYRRQLQNALEQCERHNTYGDILSFINGLDTRLQQFDSRRFGTFHSMGMHYACLAFSEPSLKHHLQGYVAAREKPIGQADSHYLVKALLTSLQTLSFQDPRRDTSKLLRLVAGDPDSNTPNLHGILYWTKSDAKQDGVGDYLSLLVRARSETILHATWNRYLQSTGDERGLTDFHSGYVYAMSLVDSGDSSGALAALKQLSECAGNNLPNISEFKGLSGLLKDDTISEGLAELVSEEEYTNLLDFQISDIEKRLGVRWDDDKALHVGISDACAASDQPILTMDGDSPGYESPERLIAEIQALGCSKVPADLGKIADLLDEYEGNLIPIAVPSWTGPDTEFYWAPQRSPVELCNKSSPGIDNSPDASLSDLGLIKVTPSRDESPFALAPTLHLVQLGYLLTKQQSPSDGSFNVSSQLEEPGYLVTWDRASGRFLIVFAGTAHGLVDTTTEFPVLAAPSGCDAIVEASPLNETRTFGPKIRIPSYRFEPDPSPDLIFDMHT